MTEKNLIRHFTHGSWWVWLAMSLASAVVMVGIGVPSVSASEASDSVLDVVRDALDGWVQFADTGNLAAVQGVFVNDGPQWRQFEAEARAMQGKPVGAPVEFTLLDLRLRRLESLTATVWVEVEARRDGFVSEVLDWDFDLIRDGGRWLVWTVVPAAEPTGSSEVPVSEAPTTSTTTTTTASDVSVIDRRDGDHEPHVAAAGSPAGTRIPVLSAWVVVVTVVGVAVAGYLAPRFDRGDQR